MIFITKKKSEKTIIKRNFAVYDVIKESPKSTVEIEKITRVPNSTLTGKKGILKRLVDMKKIRRLDEGKYKGKWGSIDFVDLEYEIEKFLESLNLEEYYIFKSDAVEGIAMEMGQSYTKEFQKAFQNVAQKKGIICNLNL